MGIGDVVTSALEAVKGVHDAKLQIDLTKKILDLQALAQDMQDENASLREQPKTKENTESLRNLFFYAREVYWRRDAEDNKAYCPACFDESGFLIALKNAHRSGRCPACHFTYLHVYINARPSPPDAPA